MEVRVDISPVYDLLARLRELKRRSNDFDSLFTQIAGIMIEVEAEWFASEGDGSWPPLADYTVRYKETHGFPPDPLIRTGALLGSLTSPQALEFSQGKSTIGTFTTKTFTWGTDVRTDEGKPYAHFHQGIDEIGMPTSYGDRPPQRQVIEWPMSPSTDEAILAAMESWMEEQVAESGLGE